MPKTILLLFLLVLMSLSSRAQEPLEKQLQDSLKSQTDLMEDFMQMMDSFDNRESYFKINVGVGNKLFSVHNNSLNALQSNSRIIFTPSLSYYHKSGFGISASGYLLTSNNKTDFYQYSITPSYDYQTDETVAAGISYTRFITKDEYAGAASPVQNDFYGYAYLKKPWLRPGLALGYSTGEYKEIETVSFNFPVIGIRTFQDTAISNLTSSSLIGTLEHTFDFYSLMSNKDDLSFTPTLLLNAGTSKNTVTHRNIYSQNVQNRKGRLKRRQSDNTSFQLESLGLSLDLNYNIGKFNFEPQLYLDYYLPEADFKKFTQVFTFNIGFLF